MKDHWREEIGQRGSVPERPYTEGGFMASTGVRRTRCGRPACPFCRYEDQVVRIVYGEPSPELIEQSQRAEVALGGCCIGLDAHQWYCRGCLRSFNAPDFPAGDAPESKAASAIS